MDISFYASKLNHAFPLKLIKQLNLDLHIIN